MSLWLQAGVALIWRAAITATTLAAALAHVARLLQCRMGVSSWAFLCFLSNPACPAGAAVITPQLALRISFDQPVVAAVGNSGICLLVQIPSCSCAPWE